MPRVHLAALAVLVAGCGDVRLLAAPAERGATIVFLDPCRPGTRVDRVLALAGDTVEIRCGVLWIGGAEAGRADADADFPDEDLPACEPGSSPPGAEVVSRPPGPDPCAPHRHYVVPPAHVFVTASPRTGPVPEAAILGRVR